MLRKLVAIGVGVSALVLLSVDPESNAGPDEFLRDIQAEGFSHNNGPNGMLSDGYKVCAAMDGGATIPK